MSKKEQKDELVCEACGAKVEELNKWKPYDPKQESEWLCELCWRSRNYWDENGNTKCI